MIVVILSVLALVALLFIVGLFLPKQREFVRSANFKSPRDKIYQVVTDVSSQTKWRSDVLRIEVIDPDTWTEVPRKGVPITFKVRRKVQGQHFEIQIVEPEAFNGYWVGTFEQTPTGSKVVFKEVITVEKPLLRVMSLVFVDLGKAMDVYMADLKKELGE